MPLRKRVPGRSTLASLERSALFHLQRGALTVAQLRRILERKVKRAAGESPDAPAWIDDVVARCVRMGLLDDARVAAGRALSLRARGASARGIAQKLRVKGVDAETAKGALQTVAGPEAELAAAKEYVRRRRLKEKDPRKALMALARQGFAFSVAKRALEE